MQAHVESRLAQASACDYQLKAQNAARYRLSWRPQLVPCSLQTMRGLGVCVSALPQGSSVCVCLDSATGQVSCAATPQHTPESAVNVSYLACVLRIFREYGREPQFSLDPKDPHNISGEFQSKAFYPSWLAGTVVGEILFQADYVLKELCMGERKLSGLDFPDIFEGALDRDQEEPQERAARQWFVVRRVDVTVASDGVLLPRCEMGVDARKLVACSTGYRDAPYTDPHDPAASMARFFTQHFAEVARRIPVVGELIELTKAITIAKFLIQSGCMRNEAAINNFVLPQCPEGLAYDMEIPTMRTRRGKTAVTHDDGCLSVRAREICVHGGVDLGLPSTKVPHREVGRPLLALGESHHRTLLPLFVQPRNGFLR